VEPLPNFPVVRDLVVEISDFMRKLVEVKPWLVRKEERALSEGEHRQTPQQMDEYKQFSMCINCLLCYAACPQYGHDPGFLGPAATAMLQRYNLDSRDGAAKERMEVAHSEEGVWSCTAVGYCSEVCPKAVDPANAVNRTKTESAVDWFTRFLRRGD
jgi:fumarate reductase iron-sulfur subunit